MAGGSLLTKLHKGFREFSECGLVTGGRPRLFGAQASGCAPIVRLVEEETEILQPVIPHTIARSLAIGSPADGVFASRAIRETGGSAAAVSDQELSQGIHYLAQSSGVFAETAGGVTVAAAIALADAGRFRPDDEIVLCITGNGLKTIDAVAQAVTHDLPTISPKLRELSALVELTS
jgi:threonine synthase